MDAVLIMFGVVACVAVTIVLSVVALALLAVVYVETHTADTSRPTRYLDV